MIIYFFIFVLGFLGVSLWSAWLVTHPKTIESGFVPGDFKLPFEEVVVRTRDDVPIAGWFIAAESAQKPAVIILHGYPAEKGDMIFLAHTLHSDFNILLIDFRSFGKSGGTHTTLGTKERLDLAAALDFLENRGFSAKGGSASGGQKIGVLGFSLGGAVALLGAADDSRVAAVVSYASFADLGVLGKETYRRLSILRGPLVFLMKFWVKIFWGVDTSYSPQKAAERLLIPVFIVHTKPDEQIAFRHAELLKNSLKNNPKAEFYFPEHGRHGELPPDFEERVRKFFVENLSGRT